MKSLNTNIKYILLKYPHKINSRFSLCRKMLPEALIAKKWFHFLIDKHIVFVQRGILKLRNKLKKIQSP